MLTISAGNLQLADGQRHGSVVVGDIVIDGECLVDTVNRVDAAEPIFHDRTLKSHDIKFTIVREHGTSEAAQFHARNARQAIPGTATLVIEYTNAAATVHRWTATQCAWKRTRNAHAEGVSSYVTYDLDAGLLVYSSSKSDDFVGDLIEGGDGYEQVYGPTPGVIDGGHYGEDGVPAEVAIDGGTY